VVLAAFVVVACGALIMLTSLESMALALVGQMLLAAGMGAANAAVFKLVPTYTPAAVGGAAGIVGGLGAFGGFAIPPLMGLFVALEGRVGYGRGFAIFLVLALGAIGFFGLLSQYGARTERVAAEVPAGEAHGGRRTKA
jgi:NNP family nitrate/nitrite transporter-like MFS transporter